MDSEYQVQIRFSNTWQFRYCSEFQTKCKYFSLFKTDWKRVKDLPGNFLKTRITLCKWTVNTVQNLARSEPLHFNRSSFNRNHNLEISLRCWGLYLPDRDLSTTLALSSVPSLDRFFLFLQFPTIFSSNYSIIISISQLHMSLYHSKNLSKERPYDDWGKKKYFFSSFFVFKLF